MMGLLEGLHLALMGLPIQFLVLQMPILLHQKLMVILLTQVEIHVLQRL